MGSVSGAARRARRCVWRSLLPAARCVAVAAMPVNEALPAVRLVEAEIDQTLSIHFSAAFTVPDCFVFFPSPLTTALLACALIACYFDW